LGDFREKIVKYESVENEMKDEEYLERFQNFAIGALNFLAETTHY
jgi:hypothetical protein